MQRCRSIVAVALTSLIVFSNVSCGAAAETFASDPDFLAASQGLCDPSFVMLNNSSPTRLSEPKYLPEWAPILPDYSLKWKAYYCRKGKPFQVITTYKSRSDLHYVFNFYETYFREHEIKPRRIFEGEDYKEYILSEGCPGVNKIDVKQQDVDESSYVKVSITMSVNDGPCDK